MKFGLQSCRPHYAPPFGQRQNAVRHVPTKNDYAATSKIWTSQQSVAILLRSDRRNRWD